MAGWPGDQVKSWASGQVARWPSGARWRIMIAFRIRFGSKELFAQGKLFLGWCFDFQKKKKMHMLLTGFGSLFWAFCAQIGNFWFILWLLMPFWDILKNRDKKLFLLLPSWVKLIDILNQMGAGFAG